MHPFQRLCERLPRLDLRLEENVMLRAIRRALVLAIPFLLIGSFALVFTSFPVPAYQGLMASRFGPHWQVVGLSLFNASFGVLSLTMCLAVSYSYTSECNDRGRGYVDPLVAALVSLCSLLSLSGATPGEFPSASLGAAGLAPAILVSVLSVLLFQRLCRSPRLRIQAFTDGAGAAFNDALAALVPALLTVSAFAAAGSVLFGLFGVGSIQHLLSRPLLALFQDAAQSPAGGLMFVGLMHLLWLFGIHGGSALEPVSRGLYAPALQVNQSLVANHLAPAHIFTKTFFDVFVLLGGCGATLCLVLAIFLRGRRKNLRRLATLSLVPALFNVNELLVFGIPIVLNPVFLVPFLGTPLLLTLVSYSATAAGLVPYTTGTVEWTTPLLLGGYAATGSLAGALLQAFNLGLGVLCYLPFVRIADQQADERMRRTVVRIGQFLGAPQAPNGDRGLIARHDDLGMAARALAADLEHDLGRGRLALAYQPQFDHRGEITGIEALLRWTHERYGPIPPPVAIALAEETRQFAHLDSWILDQACRQLRHLLDQGIDGITMSINTTAPRLEGGAVCAGLRNAIAAYRLPPSALKVEITEQDALSATASSIEKMNEIRALGVQLAMDDFGMGHTSILYLRESRFDTVKIDGSLVKGMMTNPACGEIIGSIVKLGHTLEFEVIAEFVETEEQRDRLVQLGCRQFQGHLYSRALAAEDLPGFIRRWRGRLMEAASA